MIVFFPGPRSETGEDCGEFHVHGGKAILHALSTQLVALGLCPAGPGEFSRRAFLNNKIDLVQAEAVADLVAAETEAQRRFAAENLGGRQGRLYAGWRERLLHARAMIEAELDFSDEGDVPGSVAQSIWTDMHVLSREVAGHIGGLARARILQDGFEVVILGAPNSGKSTLLNALAQRDVAIVSDEAGTTRDLIEVQLSLDGNKVRLVDTAGLRDEGGRIEKIGMERARARADIAGLVLHLIDVTDPQPVYIPREGQALLTIGSKADLPQAQTVPPCDLIISAAVGHGLDELLARIADRVRSAIGDAGDVLPSRERHVGHLQAVARHLDDALQGHSPFEVRAEHLRLAGMELGKITGAIGTEDVLGAIFSSFCIGK